MKRLLKIGLLFFVNCLLTGFNSHAQNKITGYQYWFDNDFSSRKLTMVSPVEKLELNSAISLETMTDGLHSFNICFKDARGLWSVPTSQVFYYVDVTNNKIISYQYWFDNDYSTSRLVSVTPEEQLQLNELLPLENINEGLHFISIRFKDSKGKWSIPVNQYFYKSNNIQEENKIIGYRYWVNDDIENATYVSVNNPVRLLNLNEDLDLNGLENGEYIIHFQFKDVSGKWSLVTSDNFTFNGIVAIENTFEKTIEVYPNPTTGLIIIEAEIEFPMECTLEVCDYSGRVVLLKQLGKEKAHEIDLSQLSKGIYYVRIKINNSYSYQKVVLQ